ncbi:hypothetical protein [Kocuria salsicia]|uniref:hypothetical protein n=1 Tax=Kocuria salsicia TaxID=664639 RepID=UPI0011A31891|nr:hypothetical protein [Kocuria salsicia]
MRVERVHDESGRMGLHFTPSGYDGRWFIPQLTTDLSQSVVSPDRALVAAVLLHGGIGATAFHLDHPVSVTTVTAVARFLAPDFADVSPISYQQQPFPPGPTKMHLYDGLPRSWGASSTGDRGEWDVHLVTAEASAGSFMTSNRILLATNAPHCSSGKDPARALLAAAVVIAEELGVGVIEPHFPCEVERYRELLVSTGLALVTPGLRASESAG